MGGSVGKAIDTVTKTVDQGLGLGLGGTNIQAESENIAGQTGLQHAADQFKALTDPIAGMFNQQKDMVEGIAQKTPMGKAGMALSAGKGAELLKNKQGLGRRGSYKTALTGGMLS